MLFLLTKIVKMSTAFKLFIVVSDKAHLNPHLGTIFCLQTMCSLQKDLLFGGGDGGGGGSVGDDPGAVNTKEDRLAGALTTISNLALK